MLMKTKAIYHEISPQQDEPSRHVTGTYLAKNWLSARERAQLAADIIDGHVVIDTSTLTIGQTVKLCRANQIYVSEIRFPDRVKRRQQKKFAAFFDAIGPEGRMELCRCIGIERIWNALTAAL
jgi:hypothetical protein